MSEKKVTDGDMASTPNGPMGDTLPGHEKADPRTSAAIRPRMWRTGPMSAR
ncbi:hypothetical protein ACGGKE_16915 (plasmid) [Sphingobium naphthae]|uniref:hypothetical protein n=1 Tax=Sphingobium naphthae TaxID=1886786 RepID=UPI00374A227E